MLQIDTKFTFGLICILEVFLYEVTGKVYEVSYDEDSEVFVIWFGHSKVGKISATKVYNNLFDISDYIGAVVKEQNL